MKEQVKTPVIIAIVIAAVAVLAFFGMKAMKAGDLDQGQVQYTPGKPPWEETDPSKQGPGGVPPAPGSTGTMPGGPPPGMAAPQINNGR